MTEAKRTRLSAALRQWPLMALAAMLILTALLRVLPAWSQVFPGKGETRYFGVDAYYHLRHIRATAQDFPRLMRWDPGTHYPTGQRSDAVGLFDLVTAGVAAALGGGHPAEALTDRVAAWAPVVLAMLVMVTLYMTAADIAGRKAGLLALAHLLV